MQRRSLVETVTYKPLCPKNLYFDRPCYLYVFDTVADMMRWQYGTPEAYHSDDLCVVNPQLKAELTALKTLRFETNEENHG